MDQIKNAGLHVNAKEVQMIRKLISSPNERLTVNQIVAGIAGSNSSKKGLFDNLKHKFRRAPLGRLINSDTTSRPHLFWYETEEKVSVVPDVVSEAQAGVVDMPIETSVTSEVGTKSRLGIPLFNKEGLNRYNQRVANKEHSFTIISDSEIEVDGSIFRFELSKGGGRRRSQGGEPRAGLNARVLGGLIEALVVSSKDGIAPSELAQVIGEESSKGLGNTFDNMLERMNSKGVIIPFFRDGWARSTRYRIEDNWEFFDLRGDSQDNSIEPDRVDTITDGAKVEPAGLASDDEDLEASVTEETLEEPVGPLIETSTETDPISNLSTHSLWGLTFKQERPEDGPIVFVDDIGVFGFKQVAATLLHKLAQQNPGAVFTINEIKGMLSDTVVAEATPESIKGAMHEITSRLRGFQKQDHVLYDNQKHTIGLRTDIPVNRRTPDFLE